MRTGDEDIADEIFFLRRHARPALAAAFLRAIGGKRHALDIARMADGYDHILALDQIFDILFEFQRFDPRAARGGEFQANGGEFVGHDLEHAFALGEDVEIVGDLGHDFF